MVTDGGAVNPNTIIEYNYLGYQDVPDIELVYNPPGAGSVPVKNRNKKFENYINKNAPQLRAFLLLYVIVTLLFHFHFRQKT